MSEELYEAIDRDVDDVFAMRDAERDRDELLADEAGEASSEAAAERVEPEPSGPQPCPKCDGDGFATRDPHGTSTDMRACPRCNGTGVDRRPR